MAIDPPRLGAHTFANPPDSMFVYPEVVQQINELADGSTRQRILGYRYRATLSWEENWIRGTDLSGIQAVANDQSATLTFIARPTAFPGQTIAVIWANKAQFTYWNGKHSVYNGTIELVSAATTATATFII